MKLSERSYPHPVVGNRDDVPGASFQAAIEVSSDSENIYASVSISNGSDTLSKLIASGSATYALHIECGNTLHRVLHTSTAPSFRVQIRKDSLNHVVEVNAFVIASVEIVDYRVSGQHSDYGEHRFRINAGDMLAISGGQQFNVDRDYTSFENIDSIIKVVPFSDNLDHPMQAEFFEEKITVRLSIAEFRQYSQISKLPISPILSSLIVFPVLVEALKFMKEEPELEYRWARAIRDKVEALNLNGDDDEFDTAQKMLELPIKRSLSTAYSIESDV